jgi:hypothetical protein
VSGRGAKFSTGWMVNPDLPARHPGLRSLG